MGTLLRRALVKLASCCCSCCLCACCEVRDDASDSDSETVCGANAEPRQRQQAHRAGGNQRSSELTGAVPQHGASEHRRASRQARSGHAASVPETPLSSGVAMTTLFGSPAAKKNRELADVAGSLSGSSRPSLPLNSAEEQAPLAEELQAAVAMAMRNSAINACFRASQPSRVSALRRRGQQAWRRAMRAGGPFAPGSVVGAVAAANHRRSCGHPLTTHVTTAPEVEQAATTTPMGVLPPTGSVAQPTLGSVSAAQQLSLGRHSEGFLSVQSLAASSVQSVVHAQAAAHDTHSHPNDASPANGGAEAEPSLGRLSCVSQVSNASSSYFSVLSHDARQAFTSAGVRTIGGHLNAGAASSSQAHGLHAPSPSGAAAAAPTHHQHHNHHHQTHHHHVHSQRHPQQRSAARSHAGAGASSGGLGGQGPFQHSSHPAVEAFRANQLGFGFSGASNCPCMLFVC